jgi:hypothetical protein
MGSSALCNNDFVEILEENNSGDFTSLFKYCGDDRPANFIGSKSRVKVRHVQTVNFSGSGWRIKFLGVQEGNWN